MIDLTRRNFVGMMAATGLAGCRICCSGDACRRLGVCSWSFRMPLDRVAEEMRKLNLHRIHLALQPFLEGDARHGAAEGAEARRKVEERLASGEWKLSATMLSFSYEDYSTLETIRKTGGIVPDAHWEANKKLIRAAAKLSAELKAPYLTLHAGFLDESNPKAFKTYVERVQFIADACGEAGVKLLLESGQETAADLVKFLGHVKGVGVNFDPANMILYGKGNPVEAIPLLAPRQGREVHPDAGHVGRGSRLGRWRGESARVLCGVEQGRLCGRVRHRARGGRFRRPCRRHRHGRAAFQEPVR